MVLFNYYLLCVLFQRLYIGSLLYKPFLRYCQLVIVRVLIHNNSDKTLNKNKN